MVRVHSKDTAPEQGATGPRERARALLGGRGADQVALVLAAVDRAGALARELGDDGALVDDGLSAAEILVGLGLDAQAIAAAILRPAIADAGRSSLDDLELPEAVTRLVDGVGRMDAIAELLAPGRGDGRSAHQIDQLRNLLVAMVEDVRVVLIKLAEALRRVRRLRSLPAEARERAARTALDVYAPLASRLGVRHVKWELEDLAFRQLEPAVYADIARKLDERRVDRERYIEAVVSLLGSKLAESGVAGRISGRPKHIYSIWKKMREKSLGFDDVFDLRAVRVLVDSVAGCYTALGVVHTLWTHVPKEFDDYITNPKGNDYRSLHTAVIGPGGKTLEVQIRTDEMHRHAEFGIAAHWHYKEGGGRHDQELEARIAWLRQLLEPRSEDASRGEQLEDLSAELLSDRVYVVTPRGDIVDLPAGATPLDFAYSIHTDVGHRCRGAKINGAIVQLTQPLRSGDRVEVLTTRMPGPSRDWLNPNLGYLKTARARAKARHWFRHLDHDQNVADGQEAFNREVRRLGVDRPDRAALAARFNCARFDDLLAALGRGDIGPVQLANALAPRPLERPEPPAEPERARRRRRSGADVRISGAGTLLTNIAQCCRPVPPEPVVGFITRGRGVSIHRRDCSNALRLSVVEPERMMEVDWQTSPTERYPVEIGLAAYDRPGLLKDLSTLVANEGVDVAALNLRVDERDATAHVTMRIEVPDTDRLSRVMDRLGQLPNVFEVRRRG